MTVPRTSPAHKAELAVLAAAAAWFAALCGRGLNPVDGAVQAFYGWEIAKGLAIYRDFYNPVAPASYEIQALLERLFGHHLIVGRFYALAQGLIATWAALGIGRRRLRYPFSLTPAVLCIVYTTSLLSSSHYNLDSEFFFFAAMACFDARLGRPGGLMFWGAACASLSAWSKQSMGPAAMILVLAALYFVTCGQARRGAMKEAVLAGAGLALPSLIFVLRLAWGRALMEAWICLSGTSHMKTVLLFQALPFAALAIAPALALLWASAVLVRRRPAALLPLVVFFLSAAAAAVALLPAQVSGPLLAGLTSLSLLMFVRAGNGADQGRRSEQRAAWTLLRLAGVLLFLVGVSSGLDLGHLLMAGAGAIFFAGLLMQNWWEKAREQGPAPRVAAGVFLIAIMAAGIYLDVALPQLSYIEGPRWQDTAAVNLPGMEMIRTTPERAAELERTVSWIDHNTAPDEKIFVYPWDLIIYYLSERLPATYDTFLYFEIFDQSIVRRVVADLDQNRPRVAVVKMKGDVIGHAALANEARIIDGYLAANYDRAERFGDYQIMIRKPGN